MAAAERAGAFALGRNDLHIWMFNWSCWPESLLHKMQSRLPAEDREQAERYKVPQDRSRFCVGRAMVRHLSGRYLDCDGMALQIAAGDRGKPAWRDFDGRLRFNVSHSGDWVAMAFSPAHAVGIDVQEINTGRNFDCMKMAAFAFHPQETETVVAAAAENRNRLFHDIWVCKEAVLKAAGEGLHGETRKFSVLPVPDEQRWTAVDYKGTVMNVRKLDIDQRHAGAVAVPGDAGTPFIEFRGVGDAGWPELSA
jgi:4'-phosphopantetheinyl transferase